MFDGRSDESFDLLRVAVACGLSTEGKGFHARVRTRGAGEGVGQWTDGYFDDVLGRGEVMSGFLRRKKVVEQLGPDR